MARRSRQRCRGAPSEFRLETLESRVLFSADAAGALLGVPPAVVADAAPVSVAIDAAADAVFLEADVAADAAAVPRTLVVVDAGAPGVEALLADLARQGAAAAEVVVLDADGADQALERLGEILATRHDLDALHLISHGADGALQLGGERVTVLELLARAGDIVAWRGAFAPGADLLLYGCDVAASAEGRELVDTLAQLSGTDVAASSDATGAASLGGNWRLEYARGEIGSEIALSSALRADYDGTLAIHTVSSLADSGAGSLRAALSMAGAGDTIDFAVSGTISLTSELPPITVAVTLDGTTAPGYAGTPRVTLDGSAIGGTAATGLRLAAGSDNSTVRGLAIVGFPDDGLRLEDSGSHVIESNYIGTDGTIDLGNGHDGIALHDSAGNTVGGASAAQANVVSGNGNVGIKLRGATTQGNTILNNLVGTDATGTGALGNGYIGILVESGAHDNEIGGPGAGGGNLISGNLSHGVSLFRAGAGNVVSGNVIGLASGGGTTLGNAEDGININETAGTLIGGDGVTHVGNVISGNGDAGIEILAAGADDTRIHGNRIGTDASGGTALGNARHGVILYDGPQRTLVGGEGAGEGNVISGNGAAGIVIDGGPSGGATRDNVVAGNLIGTDASGSAPLANVKQGIHVFGGARFNTIGGITPGAANTLSGNTQSGIAISGGGTSDNSVIGNRIGTTSDASVALGNTWSGVQLYDGASGNTIGGLTVAERNLISGNGDHGVIISDATTVGNTVLGNHIGTNATGTSALGNAGFGVVIENAASDNTVGGGSSGARNLISGNAASGILIRGPATTGNELLGNYIGTDASGLTAIGNALSGVLVDAGASDNIVGGAGAGEGNTVSGNTDEGIRVDGAATSGNIIIGNLVGTDTSGTGAVANGGGGIRIIDAAGTRLGGGADGEGNTVSGNDDDGIDLWGENVPVSGTVILGNRVGTTADGSTALANTDDGILVGNASGTVIGGGASGEGNLVSGNLGDGIELRAGSDATLITGNLIGTAADGITALGNGISGVAVNGASTGTEIGRGASGQGNVISANGGTGVRLDGVGTSGNAVRGNLIGTDATGTAHLGNSNTGVRLGNGASGNAIGGPAPGQGNTVSGNGGSGLFVTGADTSGNTVQGNLVGTDASGTVAIGNVNYGIRLDAGANANVIGGDRNAGEGNVFSGNGISGVAIAGSGTTGNTVLGNLVGTDANGAMALANTDHGIRVSGGASGNVIGGNGGAGEGNVISGNGVSGILVDGSATSGNTLRGNLIGTTADGTGALGNGAEGILLEGGASDTLVGGSTAAEANTIRASGAAGIRIIGAGSSNNSLLLNAIGANGGLGIDIGAVGIDANDAQDADSGANDLQNAPVLTRAGTDGGGAVEIAGSVDSTPDRDFRIDFYASATGDPSGSGEAERHLGSASVSTGPGGGASFTEPLTATLAEGEIVSATLTALDGGGASGSTSELAANVVARELNVAPVVTSGDFSMAEGLTGAGTVGATDANGDTPDYAIVGGADASLFTIDTVSGALDFLVAPDFEAPGDADADNLYEVTVEAVDGNGGAATQAITVTVTDANEMPHAADDRPGVDFDGVEAHVQIGADAALEMTATMTIEAWIDPDESANVNRIIVNREGEYEIALDADNTIKWSFANTDPGWGWYDTDVSVEIGEWSHLAVTFDNGDVTTYLNGVQVDFHDGSGTIADVYKNLDDVRIGGRQNSSTGQGFDGRIADVRIWDVARTGAGIAANMNTALTGGESNLAGYWRLDENSLVATDLAGASDGVLSSGANPSGYRVSEGSTIGEAAPGVLRNDHDADGDSLAVSEVDGSAANVGNEITLSSGALLTLNSDGGFDYDPNGAFASLASGATAADSFTYAVTDGSATDTATVTIQVVGVNDAPLITSDGGGMTASVSVLEDQVAVTTVTASDADGDTPGYTITGGADAASFVIEASTGALTFQAAPDFEAPGDADTDNVYEVTVQAADGNGGVASQAIAVTVTNVNEHPVITSAATVSAAENQMIVTTVTSSDADGDTPSYTIVGGADAARFALGGASGVLAFQVAPDFETPGDADADNVYEVTVQAADGSGGIAIQALAVTVTNANDAPTISSPGTVSAAENRTAVLTVSASDADGDTSSYTILGGADAARFALDGASGALTFQVAPDFETPGDADADNVYEVTVQAADGNGGVASQAIAVTVTNVNEHPVITSAATVSAAENQMIVTTVTSSDADGDTPDYTITGGADAASFAIEASTGALTFQAAPDFEAPDDADADNVYEVTVEAADGNGGTVSQAITVNVTDANDAPTISSASIVSVAENRTAALTVSANDADGDTSSYTIVGGADAGRFALDSASGALTFQAAPNFEAPGDADTDNVYEVTVEAIDGNGGTASQAIAVSVSDANDAPVLTSVATVNAAENQTAVTTVTSSDADGDTPSYTIVGGADAASFAIEASTGALTFQAAPDFEAPGDADTDNVYEVTVQAIDGNGGAASQAIAVTVTNANDAPMITSVATANAVENQATALTVSASDADGDTPSYTIVGGADAARFALDSASGALTFQLAPDFEAPGDADTDNVYEVTIEVADGNGGTADRTLSVTVTDLDEFDVTAPVDTDAATDAVVENAVPGTPAGITAFAVDADGSDDIVRYSLTDDAGGLFAIDPIGGVVTVTAGLDAETARSHSLTIRAASADGSIADAVFTVEVVGGNDNAPVVEPGQRPSVPENSPGGTVAGAVRASDADSGGQALSGWRIDGGDGAALFVIDPDGGEIVVAEGAVLDHETRSEYTVEVSVGDGGHRSEPVPVIVEIVDIDEAPVATADRLSALEDTARLIDPAAELLVNDIDPERGELRFVSFTAPGHGTLERSPEGGLEYRPDGDFNGVDAFEYIVEDEAGNRATASVTIAIEAVNDPPTLAGVDGAVTAPGVIDASSVARGIVTLSENTSSVGSVLAVDVDGNAFGFALAGPDAELFEIDATSGLLRPLESLDFERPRDADGDNRYELELLIRDELGGQSRLPLTIGALDVNEAPTLIESTFVVEQGFSGALGRLSGFDPDSGESLSFALVAGADAIAGGELRLLEDGLLIGSDLAAGTYEFEVRLSDAGGLVSVGRVILRVEPLAGSGEAPGLGAAAPGEAVPVPVSILPPAPTGGAYAPAERVPDPVSPPPTPPAATASPIAAPEAADGGPAAVAIDRGANDTMPRAPEAALPTAPSERDRAPRTDESREVAPVSVLVSLPQPPTPQQLADLLDSVRSSLGELDEQERERERAVTLVVSFLGVSFSIGFASWLLGSRVLLAAALAAVSVWRPLDPVALLMAGRGGADEEDAEDEMDGREADDAEDDEPAVARVAGGGSNG